MSGVGGVVSLADRVASLLLRPSAGLIVIALAVILTNQTAEVALALCLYLALR